MLDPFQISNWPYMRHETQLKECMNRIDTRACNRRTYENFGTFVAGSLATLGVLPKHPAHLSGNGIGLSGFATSGLR